MSLATIKSDFSEFEDKIFFISQAQRYLIVKIVNSNLSMDWISEYLEDLYYDSLNMTFKSFYLESIDGYEIINNKVRQSLLSAILRESLLDLAAVTDSEFEKKIQGEIELDKKHSDIFHSSYFVKDKADPEEASKKPVRVMLVLYNVLMLVEKKEPVSLEYFAKNSGYL